MQFKIVVQSIDNTGWEVSLIDPQSGNPMLDPKTKQPILKRPRKLRRSGQGEEIFPLPAEEEALPSGWNEASLPAKYRDIMGQVAGEGEMARFGQYLFNTLLGQELWQAIDNFDRASPIELALTLPADDLALNRLPWEAMHTASSRSADNWEGFLASEREVAITRRVAGTTARVDKFPSPPRVLFVVGSRLDDEVIRPGAEYMGLLRGLGEKVHALKLKLLLEATTTSLAEAVKTFRPDVVHIVCHGFPTQVGNVMRPALEFLKEEGSRERESVVIDTLIENLTRFEERTNQRIMPAVVVLNACSTATSEELKVGRPMAAELVERGVPIVVGMSGRISDQACRLFTREFYRALLEGGGFAQAAALGRRAAIAHSGYDARTTVDWALPVLFLSEAMGEANLSLEELPNEVGRAQAAVEFLAGEKYPVFCNRWDVMMCYDNLMETNEHQYLAISVKSPDPPPDKNLPRFGRTRLLKELAAQAMRDGHIPILISKDQITAPGQMGGDGGQTRKVKSWPSSFHEFSNIALIPSAYRTRDRLKNNVKQHEDLKWSWKYFSEILKLKPGDPLPLDFPPTFQDYTGMDPTSNEIRALAFRIDLERLVKAVRADRKSQGQGGDDVRLLLLVDDLHQMGGFINEILALFKEPGLRDAKKWARAVFTYSTVPADEHQKTTIDEITKLVASPWVDSKDLLTFHSQLKSNNDKLDPYEFEIAALVYKHFLLHYTKPLALVKSEKSDDYSRYILNTIAWLVQGYPSELKNEKVSSFITVFENWPGKLLRNADDEDVLNKFQDSQMRRRIG